MSKEVWTYCYVCGKGIKSDAKDASIDSFYVLSFLVCHKEYLDFERPASSGYLLETRVDSSSSSFYMCKRCAVEFKSGLSAFIERFEKKFGNKKRWIVKKREGK